MTPPPAPSVRAALDEARRLLAAGPREAGLAPPGAPAGWIFDNADLLWPGMRVLDVAAGSGRHARLFAAAGWPVTAIDRDAGRLAALATEAALRHWPLATTVRDLETGAAHRGDAAWALMVVTPAPHLTASSRDHPVPLAHGHIGQRRPQSGQVVGVRTVRQRSRQVPGGDRGDVHDASLSRPAVTPTRWHSP